MARIKTGSSGGSGGSGGSGPDSSDLTNQLAILQQISGLYQQVNQSLEFQKTSLQEIAALNQQVCNNICVSNYSNAADTIVDLTAATNSATVSTQNFNTQTINSGKGLRSLQSEIDNTADGFKDVGDEVDNTTKNMKKSGGLLSKFFGNIKDSITGMGTSALQGIFNIIDGLGKLTFSIMASPFMFMNKMFEIAGQGGDNSFALALEDIREEFGNLREGLAKDTIDIHKSMITDTKELIGKSAYRIFGEDRAAILQEALKTVKSLGASARPFIDTFGKDAVVKLALFQKGLGLSEEATKHLADSAMNAGKDISEVTTELTKMSAEMGRAIGESPKVISRAVGEAMKDLTAFGGATIKQLAKSEAYLRKLGSTMEEVKGLLSTFETLDAASEASAKLAQSFGVTVDAFKLMQMQDPGEQVDLLRKSFKDAGVDISKFNRQQHSLLAETLGLDAATAANVFSINKQGESYDKLGKKVDEASKKKMTEAEALKEVADSIKRLIPSGGQVTGLFDALVQGFSTGVQRTSEWRGTMRSLRGALRDVTRAGRELGTAFVKYFPGVKDMLGGLKEMFSGGKFRKFTQGFTKDLKQFFKDLSEGKASFPELFKKLKEKFFNYFDASNPAAKKMVDGIKTFLKTFGQIFAGIITEIGKGIASGISGIGKGGAIDKGVQEAGDSFMFILRDLYAPILEAAWGAIKDIFGAIFDRIVEWFPGAIESLAKKFLDSLLGSFTGAFTSFGGAMKFIALAAIGGIIGGKIFSVLKSAFGPILNMIKSLFSAKGSGGSSGNVSEDAKKAGDDASKMNWKSLGTSLLGFMGFLLVLGILLKLGILQYLVEEVSKLDPIGILNLVGLSAGLLIGMQKIAEVSSGGSKFDLKGLLTIFLGFGIFLFGLWGILELGILQSAIKKANEIDTGELGKFVLVQLAMFPALAAAAGIAFLMSKIKFSPGAAGDIAIALLAASVVLLAAGASLALVVWMFKKSEIDMNTVEIAIVGLLGMVAIFTAMGAAILVLTLIGTKISATLGVALGMMLAGIVAAAIFIPAAAKLVIIVSDMFKKNSITMENVKIVTAGLLGMIAILIAASGAMIAMAGGSIGGLVGGAVSWLSGKLFGEKKSDPFEFIKNIADELTKKPGGLIDKFTSNNITKSEVDLVIYALDSMLGILFAAGTFVAAMAGGGAILALSGGLAIVGATAGILASFKMLDKITDSTHKLIDKVIEKKITEEQVKLVTDTLDGMVELLYNVSIAMGAMAIGGIGGFIGGIASIFTSRADPFAVMVKLIDIVSENAEKIKKINATPQDLESFKAFNIAIEGVTMLSDAAGKFIFISSQAANLSGSNNVEGILTSLNNLLSTLLGPNGIAGIITQITSFMQVVAGEKDLQESIKAFSSLLSAVGNIMSSMGSGISELGSKVAENIDDDDMEKMNEILKTAAESSTKMMQTSQESIIKILQTIEPMIANISSLNIKPEKAEAISSILNSFAAIMKAITPDSGTLSALKTTTTTKEDMTSSEKIEEKLPIDSVVTYINTISGLASTLISTLFQSGGALDTIIQATSKMTKNQIDGLKAVGDILNVLNVLFKMVLPDPAVLSALKVTETSKLDVENATKTVEKTPIQEYMTYLSNVGNTFKSVIDGIKPLITDIISLASGMEPEDIKKLQQFSGIMSTLFGFLGQLAGIANPKTITETVAETLPNENKSIFSTEEAKKSEKIITKLADVTGSMEKFMSTFEANVMPSMGRIINSLKSSADFNISDKEAKKIETIGKVITTITDIFSSLQSVSESFKDSPAQDPATIKQVTDTVAATGTKDKLSLMADAVRAAIGKITDENSPLREAIISLKDKGLSFLDANTGGNLIEKRMEKLEKIVSGISNVFTKLKDLDDQLGNIGSSPAPNLINAQNIQNSGINLRNNLFGLTWFGHNIDTAWASDKDNPTYYLNLANQKLRELQQPIKNLTTTINSLNSSNDATVAINLQSQGLKNSISLLVENLKTAYDDLNSIGSLKAQIQTELLNGELAASKSGKYEYKIDRAGVHFELSIEVNMKADEVETVLVKRKNSLIRNALNYTDKQTEVITMRNNPEQLMPVNQSNEALLAKYRAGGSK